MATEPPIIHALLLEDSAIDADLLESHLLRSGVRFVLRRATGRQSYMDAMDEGDFEIILADYSLPDFDGLIKLAAANQALHQHQSRRGSAAWINAPVLQS